MENYELILYGAFFTLPGVLFLLFPAAFLKFGGRSRYKNAEPSDSAIVAGKIAGGIGILIGLAMIITGLVS